MHADGAAVRDDEKLTVATSDYVALGGDGLVAPLHLAKARVDLDTGKQVLDGLIAGLQVRRRVRPDDPALLDPKHPRWRLPGALPIRCGAER